MNDLIKILLLPLLILVWGLNKLGSLTLLILTTPYKLAIWLVSHIPHISLKFPNLPSRPNLPTPSSRQRTPQIIYHANIKKILKKPAKKKSFYPSNSILTFFSKLGSFYLLLLTKIGNFVKKAFYAPLQFSKKSWYRLNQSFDNSNKHQGKQRRPVRRVTYHNKPLPQTVLHKTGGILNKILPSPLRIALVLTALLVAFFLYSLFLIVIAHDLPSPTKLSESNGPLTTEFYDRKGELLYRLYEGKNRTIVPLTNVSPYLVQATIAIEDKNFYGHSGIDLFGIARSGIAFFRDSQVQGGSTITQQLIKNTLLTPERSWTRKMKEAVLAFWTERIYSKNEILQMYFNEIPYGGPAWGASTASLTYFNKNVKDLTLAEAAYLAGLPASPTTYSPYGTNPDLAKERQKEVLRRMIEDGYITKEQATEAFTQKLDIKAPIAQIKAPHFVMYTREKLAQKYGEKVVSQGGLKIVTSIDLEIQRMAEKIVAEELVKVQHLNVTNGAAMITDSKTGQILAMVGSKDYYDEKIGNFNVATAPRQPGSSLKPVVFATGFKQGWSPGSVILDVPTVYRTAWETYAPVNYDGKFHGAVTVRQALGSSYNIPAVKMLASAGIPAMLQTAHDMGITTLQDTDRYGLSLALGGGEVKLVDMMGVYGTFSQMGIYHEPQPVIKITDSAGNIIEDNVKPEGRRVLTAGIAYLITDILADNNARTPAFGPNSLLRIPGHTVPVKTGTTDNKRDNWTFGYTPEYVVGVWVGNNDNVPMNPALSSGVTGAAPIWNRLITTILKDRPPVVFERPSEVVAGSVGGNRDLVIDNSRRDVIGSDRSEQPGNHNQRRGRNERGGNITFTDPINTTVDR